MRLKLLSEGAKELSYEIREIVKSKSAPSSRIKDPLGKYWRSNRKNAKFHNGLKILSVR